MHLPDLNQLVTLDVLLTEGSVARAATRLQLSPSAMSRALQRLRATLGDPLLVRAGRGLVPTPRALELRETAHRLVEEAASALRLAEGLDLSGLERTFTLSTSDGFVENFGAGLIALAANEAPGVRLRFLPRLDRNGACLRDGSVDLETGVIGRKMPPEIRAQALFRDQFVGVMRLGHPLEREMATAEGYASARHVIDSRHEVDASPIDEALAAIGLERLNAAVVSGFSTAIAVARGSDLIASVPGQHTGNLRSGLYSFALPFTVPPITVSMLWHPRLDSDPAHRWLRRCLRRVCATPAGEAA